MNKPETARPGQGQALDHSRKKASSGGTARANTQQRRGTHARGTATPICLRAPTPRRDEMNPAAIHLQADADLIADVTELLANLNI